MIFRGFCRELGLIKYLAIRPKALRVKPTSSFCSRALAFLGHQTTRAFAGHALSR
jgi:hypothetical protein